jgi:hypothetical protein
LADTIDEALREDNVLGDPTSGKYKPLKAPLRRILNRMEGLSAAGVVHKKTHALLALITPPTENYGGAVYRDPDPTKNGLYIRTSTAWEQVRRFSDYVALLTVTGGTANAISADIEIPVDPSNVVIFVIEPNLTNNGPVTLALNGGAAKSVKDINGDEIASGLWRAGRKMMLQDDGAEYRMLSDLDADAAAAAAAASALVAQGWAELASEAVIPAGSITLEKLASSAIDYFLTFSCVNALEQSEDRSGGPVMAGPLGNGIFDGFNVTSFLNEGAAVNLDTSVDGEISPAETGTVLATPAPDGSSSLDSFTMFDKGVTLTNGATVNKIGVYSTIARNFFIKIVHFVSGTTYAVDYDVLWAHPGGGWADHTLTSPFVVPGSGLYYPAQFQSSGSIDHKASRNRVYYSGNSTTSNVYTDDTGNVIAMRRTENSGIGDLTVTCDSVACPVAPEWGMLFAFVDLETAVMGTDIVFALSRDGSAFQTVLMEALYTRQDGSVCYASGRVDMTGLATGTTGVWRVQTDNAKKPLIKAVGVLFGVGD